MLYDAGGDFWPRRVSLTTAYSTQNSGFSLKFPSPRMTSVLLPSVVHSDDASHFFLNQRKRSSRFAALQTDSSSRISRRAEQNKLDRASISSVVASLGKCWMLTALS